MLSLDYKPVICCWVHQQGQAESFLAKEVLLTMLFSVQQWGDKRLHSFLSSDTSSGIIRLYDERGNGSTYPN